MEIVVQHQGMFCDLLDLYPFYANLYNSHIEKSAKRYWYRDDGGDSGQRTYDLQVVFLGKSGYGKSSIINSLVDIAVMDTSPVSACTFRAECVEFEIRDGHYLSFTDLPGIGENQEKDIEYLKLYERMIKKSDVVVYVIRADCRDYSIDEIAFSRLFCDFELRRKVIVVINCCDKIEPLSRKKPITISDQQLLAVKRKIGQIRPVFSGVRAIVPCSADLSWNIDLLAKEIHKAIGSSLP